MKSAFSTGQRVVDTEGRISIVITKMHWNAKSDLVRVRLENSTRYELIPSAQLDLLPTEEQYPAFGGSYGQ